MSITGIHGQPLEVTVVSCSNLKDTEGFSRKDPYVIVEYGSTKYRTGICTDGGKSPIFQEKFVFPLIESLRELNVVVWSSNTLTLDDFVGSGKIQLHKVLSQGYDDSVWPLQTKTGRYAGEVKLVLHYAIKSAPGHGLSESLYMLPATPQVSAPGDEPLTPAGRLFAQEEMRQIIHCAIGLKNPIEVDTVINEIHNCGILHHPRFSSILVRDHRGKEYWRPTQVDINRHLLIIDNDADGQQSAVVNAYLADLSTTGLSMEKPLWEIHVLRAQRCLVFRIHHSLGDGISLMSMLLSSCRKLHNPHALPTLLSSSTTTSHNNSNSRNNNIRPSNSPFTSRWTTNLWNIGLTLFFCIIFVLDFILRCLWVCDRKTPITGGAGVELWPRKIATASFSLQHMKTVKTAVPNATINDVLFAVISSGISRYLDFRAPNGLPNGLQVTGLAMVNLRKQPGLQELSNLMKSNSGARWGNKFGMILLPIYYHQRSSSSADPLEYLKRAKAMIDRKKQSLEAHFSYKIGDFVMSTLGPKFAALLNYRILCNTTFTISNVVGPQEEIMIGCNPITFLRANNSALPHALILNMVSYAGRADMQVQVAKDIIPDPEILAKCFEDALLEMKDLVTTKF